MRVALDFDGVLCAAGEGKRMGPLVDGAQDAVWTLVGQGHEVIVHSCRANSESGLVGMVDWLEWAGLVGDVKVWDQPGKPRADCYLDDKAVRFDDWGTAMSELGLVAVGLEIVAREG